MARNNNKKPIGNVADSGGVEAMWKQPSDAKFINVSLNDTDKKWLHDHLDDAHDYLDALYIDAGKHAARISVIPDVKSGRYNATFTSYDQQSVRYGYILSVRAATPAMALYCLAYANLYKDGAWTFVANRPTDMFG